MAKPKNIGIKYDSFNDKIIDHQIRKTLWIEKNLTREDNNKFHGAYNAISQLKKDIKDRIRTHLDGALLYSKVIQYGSRTRSPYNDQGYEDIINNEKTRNFTLLNQPKQVREKIENETQEFIEEIFNEKRMRNIFDAIYFADYSKSPERSHEKYRIVIAELLMAYAVQELQRYAEPFLFGQLKTANEIATFIRKNKVD